MTDPLFELFGLISMFGLFAVIGWLLGRLIAVVIGALYVGD